MSKNKHITRSVLAVAAMSLLIGATLSSKRVKADETQWLFALATDGANFSSNGKETQLQCQAYLDVVSGALNSFTIKCNDNEPDKTYTLAQLTTDQLIKQVSGHKICQLKTDAGFDPVHGGTLTMTYLKSGLGGDSFATYDLQIQNIGNQFIIMTGTNNGSKPFNYMFLKAKKFLGKVIGIDSIQTQESNNANPQLMEQQAQVETG